MKRKLRNIAWILLLLVLSVPTGYFISYVDSNMLVESEYVLNLIVGGIACAFVFGMLSLILFLILKNRKLNDPAKPALLVSSVLMIALLAVYTLRMPEAKKERARHAFMIGFREKMNEVIRKKIKEMPDAPPVLAAYSDDICYCIYSELEKDDVLVDELMADPDPRTFPLRNPKMKKINENCFALYLSIINPDPNTLPTRSPK